MDTIYLAGRNIKLKNNPKALVVSKHFKLTYIFTIEIPFETYTLKKPFDVSKPRDK